MVTERIKIYFVRGYIMFAWWRLEGQVAALLGLVNLVDGQRPALPSPKHLARKMHPH